ncbi:hypothetical protein AMES_7128 [Amycolatopsis mediterranei S699]|uniref:PucR C-terminal helix-turn-helix domain-containing protein n=2 Tax=Amycolatopsis mediterranei TaxID=33910 RepID=A0A0H3DH39_AMYMU|nr:helix-turn-helix domain-containing protein [Amycolatopsis mediterranei]ADJ48954.1 conserved hypothetical protein [Amycolatopsis mediterranei U32]AEK45902.1 hypothetical protein RAM_37175 [Amycolatopsis mediterranei S699]AFO80662.1 hypothetical protein AMES_7128 [Amycolatopsis mediterranei S699]AGT87790.1 hypothetical protein B737_7128 [Amycolatopsis mediterranei RB]KDU93928.1 transcriptional regulator [Amycolatopsis mediterranei]
MSLADFMHAIRITHRVMWGAIAKWTAGRSGGHDVAPAAAGLVLEFVNRASTMAAQVYLDTEQVLALEGDRARRDLLEDLLAGHEPGPGPRLAAAREAGLAPDAQRQVLVAVPVTAMADQYALRSAVSALARALGDPVRSLAVVRQDEIVIVRSLPTAGGDPPSGPVRAAWRTLAEQGIRLAIGISTTHDTTAGTPKAYREATAALGTLPKPGGVAALAELTAFEYLTLHADDTVARLIPTRVRTFVTEDLHAGATLTETVLCYVRTDLNVKAAAQALGIHVNTAHHRLARVEERTGYDLRRLAQVQELLIAISLLGGFSAGL